MIERVELPVDALRVDPLQSREEAWSGDDLDRQLAESIGSEGLYHDILVRPIDNVGVGVTTDTTDTIDSGDTPEQSAVPETEATTDQQYAIIAGSRRYHAAMEAGYETVPCKVWEFDDIDAAWASLLENTDRRELSEQEVAQQLKLIYELVRPVENAETVPEATALAEGATTADLTVARFDSDKAAVEYVAEQFLGRSDKDALNLVRGHLRTANLPPTLQALFKPSEDRTAQEQTALDNFGIDTRTRFGSGEGRSSMSREIVALHSAFEEELDTDSLDATDAVLETVSTLRFDEMSERELRRTLREFRHDVSSELETADDTEQVEVFTDTLTRHSEDLKELHEEIKPQRPFKKVDVIGPETQRHSRWHVQVMQNREVNSHGELVRELYTERLETLADKRGWE